MVFQTMTFIYALCCPDTEEIRYIGKADNPPARLRGHISRAKTTNEAHHSCNWIRSLIRNGKLPSLIILEQVPDGIDWREAERRHIATAQAKGLRLTNITPGGDGIVLSEDGRRRVSEKNKARWRDPEYARKCRDSMSAALIEKHRDDPDYHTRCVTGSRAAWALRKATETYQVDHVREIVLNGPLVVFGEEMRSRFPDTQRAIIWRHLKALCREGILHCVSTDIYARNLESPGEIGSVIAARSGLDLCEDDFALVSVKTLIRIRSKGAGEFTRPIRVGDSWLAIKKEARDRLVKAAIAASRCCPESRQRRSAAARASWMNHQIRQRRVEAIRQRVSAK
jgi:hypothetical protein